MGEDGGGVNQNDGGKIEKKKRIRRWREKNKVLHKPMTTTDD